MSNPKTIGFVGDLHAGSHVGLWPLDELPEKKHVACRYLHQCWTHFVDSCPSLDLLVLMGDLIDGKQYKSSGTGIFTSDLGEQAGQCSRLLAPLATKAKSIYRVWGTPYHESFDNVLKIIDSELKVAKVSQVIDLQLGNHILNLAHHPASGSALYQGTVADRETLWSQIAAFENKVPNCRWMVRAHKHTYYRWETRCRTMVGMPCWQLPTAHAVKQNYWRFQPSLGGMLMLADDREDSGYRFLPTLYDVPMPEVTKWQA